MISLDSDDWQQLQDACGVASDIPSLLKQLKQDVRPKKNSRDEPWFSLWSALCHQGDVFDSSYAAVPHIVELGIISSGPLDSGFFFLPACIEVARKKGRGPEMPSQLADSYFGALGKLHECAYRADEWDSGMAQSVAAALAAAKGQHAIAQAIIKLDEDIIRNLLRLYGET